LNKYPAHSPEELKEFYSRTLQKIPPDFWNQHIFKFNFKVDSSLMAGDGSYLNPNIPKLAKIRRMHWPNSASIPKKRSPSCWSRRRRLLFDADVFGRARLGLHVGASIRVQLEPR